MWFITLLMGTCMLYSTRTTMPLLIPSVRNLRKMAAIHRVFVNYLLNLLCNITGGSRIEMEQNGFGHCAELVFLGIHDNTSESSRNCTIVHNMNSWMTDFGWKVLGGYFSDRLGGQRVIFLAAVGWSLITFWMPNLLLLAPKSWSYTITFVVAVRIINGACQGVHFPSMISLTSQVCMTHTEHSNQ